MEFIKRDFKLFILSGCASSGKNTVAKLIEQGFSDKKCITISFGHYLKDYVKNICDWDGSEETKPRELLQQLGIELIKNKINSKLLIDRVLEDIEVYSYFYDVIIVSDARLIDEIETLKNKYKNSICIKIIRNSENELTDEERNHVTETDFNNYDNFDYVINNGTYKKLKEDIESIIRGES